MRTGLDNPEHAANPALYAESLTKFFKTQQRAIVAYSGGVDSALLAYTAHLALKDRMVAVLADSPSLARREFRFAVNFAETHGIAQRAGQPVENGGLPQEAPDTFGLALQDLFDQIVHDVPVVSSESLYEPRNVLPPLHRECRQLEACNPAFGTGFQ